MDQAASDAQLVSEIYERLQFEETTVPARQVRSKPFNWDLPGFEGRARVFTAFGLVPIAALRRRDPVRTISGAFKRVQWVDKIQLDADFLERHPQAQPVYIPRNAFKHDIPTQEILVSPTQMLKPHGPLGYYGNRRAESLKGQSGIAQSELLPISWTVSGVN